MNTKMLDTKRIFNWCERHPLHFYGILIALQVVKNGVLLQPNFDLAVVAIARDPFQSFADFPDGARYVTTSFFMPLLLHTLGIESAGLMVAMHVIAAGSFLAVIYLCTRTLADASARMAALTFLGASPVIPASFNWLGYDTITLLLLALMVLAAGRLSVVFVLSILLGSQHFEIGLTALVAWGVASIAVPKKHPICRPRFVMVSLLGTVLGRISVALIHAMNKAPLQNDRIGTATNLYRRAVSAFVSEPFSLLWSILGIGWFALAVLLIKSKSYQRLAILASVVFLWLIAGSTLDASRVGIVSSFLLLFGLIVHNEDVLKSLRHKDILIALLVFILIPRIWIWEGNYTGSCLSENIAQFILPRFESPTWLAADCRLYWVTE